MTVSRAALHFYNKEQAADYCRTQGWDYEVQEPNEPTTVRQKRFAGYGDNFTVKRAGIPIMDHLPSERK